jgi:hypothetical protein
MIWADSISSQPFVFIFTKTTACPYNNPTGETNNMSQSFPCPACGAPNEPEAGQVRMACTYCGANLNVPEHLQTAAIPKAEKMPEWAAPAPSLEKEAPDLLRKAEPIVTKAWNTYAAWTWVRRALPACLTIIVIGLCACGLLVALPFFFRR